MQLLCHSGCKEGMPIPWVGWFLCTGVCNLLCAVSDVCQPISTSSRSNVCGNSKDEELSKPRSDYFRNQDDSTWYDKGWE